MGTTRIFVGIRADGSRFRPSVWAEMLSGVACCQGRYSPYLYPVYTDKGKGICVDERLKEQNLCAYQQVMDFISKNGLMENETK